MAPSRTSRTSRTSSTHNTQPRASPKKPRKKKGPTTVPNFTELQAASQSARTEHGKAKKTRTNYTDYLKNGRKLLSAMVKTHRDAKDKEEDELEALSQCLDTPNKWTAEVIQLIIVQKCFTEGCQKSTADGIQAAWADHFDNMEGFEGPYSFDAETGVHGNPARAHKVMETVHNVKKRDRDGGSAATRNHAEAITTEEMDQIYNYSIVQCPDEMVERFLENKVDRREYEIVVHHVMMRAFISTAFTLWTRNFETCQLQGSDLTLNCYTKDQFHQPFFKLLLRERKGHLNKSDSDCSRETNTYEIYSQPLRPSIDAHKHLPRWLEVLTKLLGHPIRGEELLFPYIAPNFVIHSTTELTQAGIQSKIDELASAAGIERRFTTHSFRRGGAQYRFMFAPIGERWSLKIVRWWGGWAQHEGVNTLMNYLLDSLGRYETNYGDALYTARLNRDDSFMGDHGLLKPMTMHDFRDAMQMERMHTADIMQRSVDTMQRMSYAALAQIQSTLFLHPSFSNIGPSNNGFGSFGNNPLPPLNNGWSSQGAGPMFGNTGLAFEQRSLNSNSTFMSTYNPVVDTVSDAALLASPAQVARTILRRPLDSVQAPNPPAPTVSEHESTSAGPPPGVCIPNIPRSNTAWKVAIDQWFIADPKTGLALKDWPKPWYTKAHRQTFGAKRGQREIIAKEWKRLGSDDAAFVGEYGDAVKTLSRLREVIRERRSSRRRSKNGTHAQRCAARGQDSPSDSEEDEDD